MKKIMVKKNGMNFLALALIAIAKGISCYSSAFFFGEAKVPESLIR